MEAVLPESALPLLLSRFHLVTLESTMITGVMPQKLYYNDMRIGSGYAQTWSRLISQKLSYNDRVLNCPCHSLRFRILESYLVYSIPTQQ